MLALENITKAYGTVFANYNASLKVETGEIHAVVGENGAGKTTLMRIACGELRADAGHETFDDRDVTGWNVNAAIAAGVGMVHQHFMLVPTLTVAENMILGREPFFLNPRISSQAVRELSESTGLAVDADARVSDLSVGEAQRAEILKALYHGATTLILDEPTAVLTPREIEELWKVLRGLREKGGTVILITHKLDEVMAIADTVTVMRNGQTVGQFKTNEITSDDLALAMVGREIPPAFIPARRTKNGAPVLEVEDLVVEHAVDGVTFSVSPGEIFGIAGVEGNGQHELIEAIAGYRRVTSGSILRGGVPIERTTVRRRGALGIAHIPADRRRRGLVLDYTVAENLILGRERSFGRFALDRMKMAIEAQRLITAFDIRPHDPRLLARQLSGGNQQKVVVAREMAGIRDFHVLLAAQPTRGIDIGAIETIHAHFRLARSEGRSVVLVSSDLNELLALADRIAVMLRGKFVAILDRDDATMETLGRYMAGAA
ncbi:MAG TPA: ABC transporter ATP-binding protein [Gemmatimonadaceae bacterium]|nr:ABC transporter ATP-binding protein [Gemmatimonadaceae bacterium]